MSPPPLVSVIVATYNRSRVLAHAIASVRRQTMTDWELIVVGDHCTDDSGEIVASFRDPRIAFVNLPSNAGEQSGPNNEGLRRARGRFIAYLNHDDMYFPDHLASAVACCERERADLVWSPVLLVEPAAASELETGAWKIRLIGVPPADDYDPRVFVFASAWLLRRELADVVGGWRPAAATFTTSSQDWLFRAWKSGARMRFNPKASVLAVPGGARPGSYTTAASPEHEYFSAQFDTNPDCRAMALERAALGGERELRRHRVVRAIRWHLMRPVSAAAVALGMHPFAPYFALRYGRRGNVVNAIRRRTGLGKIPAAGRRRV